MDSEVRYLPLHIYKGLVYAPEHGLVAYTVPGMAAFISRQVG